MDASQAPSFCPIRWLPAAQFVIKALITEITRLTSSQKVRTDLLSHEHVRKIFFAEGKGTKYALAEILAKQFPEELGSRLPPKRRL